MASSSSNPLSLDLSSQFMQSLVSTLGVLKKMYPDCSKTQAHVDAVISHSNEAKTISRSIKMWHKSMDPFYVDIAQTKDVERRHRGVHQGLLRNWFFLEMDMATKWKDAAFDPSREKFIHALRVLNGLAFMQNSFLGKLGGAIQEITKKMKLGSDGEHPPDIMSALGSDTIMEIIPKIMELVNVDTLLEINRMLPHVTYILGGKDKLLGMLDQTLGDSGSIKPILMQMMTTLMPMMAMAGNAGGDSVGEGTGEFTEEKGKEFVEKSTTTIRSLIERISDPDNVDPIGETLSGFGIDMSKLQREGGARVMDPEEIKRSFQVFKDQFGDGALASVGSLLQEKFASGNVNMEEMTELAKETLSMNGIEIKEEQMEAVRKLTTVVAQLGEGAGEADEAGAGSGAGTGAGSGAGAGAGTAADSDFISE